jgi:hypothetical protein
MNPLILRRVGALLLTLATAPSFATEALAAGVPSQDLELIVRYDSPPRLVGNGSVLSAAVAGRSLSAFR